MLRGSTNQMVDEAERSPHDPLSVLSQTVKETCIVLGGGCSRRERERGQRGESDRGGSVCTRPASNYDDLADNSGYDSSELVEGLRAAQYEGQVD